MKFKSNRLSAFFCLLGLAALVPAYFLPALLVTNSVEGSWWYSIWDGIREFHSEGDYFLAILIFVFSMIFPLAKLLLTFACCMSERLFGPKATHGIVRVAGWTAKYSMLDVLVMAMLIVLVKVDEYVKFIPTVGMYLFAAAITCSVLAHWCFEPPHDGAGPARPARTAGGTALASLLALAGVAGIGLGVGKLVAERGGMVDTIRVTSLNERVVPRSIDRLKTLSEAYGDREGWLPDRRLLASAANWLQALASDTGVYEPNLKLAVETAGETIETPEIEMGLEEEKFESEWRLDEPIALADIRSIVLSSRVKYNRWMSTSLEEESLSTQGDPYRSITRRWYGKVFQFDLLGPPRRDWLIGWGLLIPSALLSFAAFAGLLVPPARRVPVN